MKRYTTAILLLFTLLFTGCFSWEQIDCDDTENCVLRFSLAGGNIRGKIEVVDYQIFDVQENCIDRGRMVVSSRDEDNVVLLSLDPGEYHIVCWGNVLDNSEIVLGTNMSDSFVRVISPETGCPLYYGPCDPSESRSVATRAARVENPETLIVIPTEGIVEKEIPFVRAHRRVNVYVQNIEGLADYDGSMPWVEFTELPYQYDFHRNSESGRRNFERLMDERENPLGGKFPSSSMTAPICDFEDAMSVRLKYGADKSVFYSLDLKRWVEQNEPDDVNEFDILFTVGKNSEITVTLPDWEDVGTDPEL